MNALHAAEFEVAFAGGPAGRGAALGRRDADPALGRHPGEARAPLRSRDGDGHVAAGRRRRQPGAAAPAGRRGRRAARRPSPARRGTVAPHRADRARTPGHAHQRRRLRRRRPPVGRHDGARRALAGRRPLPGRRRPDRDDGPQRHDDLERPRLEPGRHALLLHRQPDPPHRRLRLRPGERRPRGSATAGRRRGRGRRPRRPGRRRRGRRVGRAARRLGPATVLSRRESSWPRSACPSPGSRAAASAGRSCATCT